MTRSVVRSRYGAAVVAVLFGSMTLLAAGTADAKKKKKADDEAAAQANDSPAAQAGDTEKPKTIIDPNQEAPKADSLGHVHFASPNTEGVGRVAVKAAPEAKIKVFLEGRYFGTAPVTIYSVPKGDYIVEATYPNGKQVSKPVSVGGDQETEVDLGGAKALTASGGGSSFFTSAEMTPGRMMWTKIFLVTAGVGVVGAVAFGILELGAESDYNNAMTQAEQDEIANRGKRYALLTNVGIVVAAVGLVGAGIAGYPLIFKSGEKRMATTLTVTPAAGPNLTGGVLTLRF
jgi:hypothetical protein